MPRYCGVDIGTSSVKIGVYDDSGHRLSLARVPYDTRRPFPGRAEQDPQAWLQAVCDHLEDIGSVEGISFGGLMNTYVPVDRNVTPLGPAVTWEDERRPQHLPTGVATSSYRSRTAWMRASNLDTWERTRWVLLPKDYVIQGLSGQTIGDTLSWNGVLVSSGSGFDADLDEGARSRIPDLGPPDSVITSRFGPVVIGVPDTVAAIVGCGLEAGTAYSMSGTSESIGLLSEIAEPSAGIHSAVPVCGRWLHAGPSSAGGIALEWAARVLTSGDVRALSGHARASRHSDPPLFVPYLSGERAPTWNSSVKGAFLWLKADHVNDDLCFAVVEGIEFAVRRLLAAIETSAGVSTLRMRGGGGSLVDPFIAQLRANVCNRVLEVAAEPETGTRGAACLAFAGSMVDLEEAASSFSPRFITYEPRTGGRSEERFQRWLNGAENVASLDRK